MQIAHSQEKIKNLQDKSQKQSKSKKSNNKDIGKESWLARWFRLNLRLSPVERMEFVENLSMILQAGVPVVEAFEMILLETKKKNIRKVLTAIHNNVEQGIPLSESLSLYPKLFSPSFVGSVRIGEMSGGLVQVMDTLSKKEKRDMELRSKLIGMLTYPVVVLFAVVLVMVLMMVFVVPKIVGLFRDTNVVLPIQTRIVIAVSDFFVLYIVEIIIGVVAGIFILWALSFFKAVKKRYNFIVLHLPLFGKMIRQATLIRITMHLHSLLKSGVTIVEAIDLIASTMKNVYYRESLLAIARSVEQGKTISEGMKMYPKVYPPLMARMLSVGERTGNLTEISLKISDFYDKRLQAQINVMTSMLSPIILIVIGLAVGFVALAIIGPIYQFMDTI